MKELGAPLRGLSLALFLLLVVHHPALSAGSSTAPRPATACWSDGAPIEIELTLPDPGVAPGAVTRIKGIITSRETIQDARLSYSLDGSAEIAGPTTEAVGILSPGQGTAFEIPVRFLSQANATIQVRVASGNLNVPDPLVRVRSLYVIFRDGVAMANMRGHVDLELRAIQADLQAGKITAEAAESKTIDALRIPGEFSSTPLSGRIPIDAARTLEPVRPGTARARARTFDPAGSAIHIEGTVQWRDENNNIHPAFGVSCQIWDDDLGPDEFVDVVATGSDGTYSIDVDNDDGIGAGDRDIYVKFLFANNQVAVVPLGGGDYATDSPVHDETPDGSSITENFTAANTGTGPVGGILTGASWIAIYARNLNGGTFISSLDIEWPGDPGSFYDGAINLSPDDRWDWDTLHHEFGHHTQAFFDIENNPGGAHSSASCHTDDRPSKDEGLKLAWGESWPTYFGTSGQQELGLASLNVPRVGDTRYSDRADDGTLGPDYDLETPGDLSIGGEGNERAIMRLFWDLYDNVADGRDNVSQDDQVLFDRVNASNADILSQAWSALRSPLSNQLDLAYGAVASDQFLGPVPISPAAGGAVSPSNRTFSWSRQVNCGGFSGNDFDLVIYDANTFAKLLTVPAGNATSTTISEAQVGALAAVTHNALWAVEGRNTSSPSTGPYLGANNAVIVNRPPVADAGPDQPGVECTSATTTAVALNGLGSSDPDGDALTYSWSAPGVVFNNASSPTPTGQFPFGTTVVTLTVSDGIDQDTDQVSITVVDTTPPVIVCPADITVECTASGGTPANDPQLLPFFAGVSATDVCDTTPTIANNAPLFFPKGETTVTFTATDDHSNSSQCQAKVRVVDTTPPVITVTLNRDSMWPPNHKLVEILATVEVEDICDPNPTFVLTSITSNEPINGPGDGNTAPDWTEADFGTPDTQFKLRSERAGGGSGRIYTILYTASDADGNTAQAQAIVRVAHDQSGEAILAFGFTADGTAIDPQAEEIVLVLPSRSADPTKLETDPSVTRNPRNGTGSDVVAGGGAFDAASIDVSRAWIGNVEGVVGPTRVSTVDANGDGLKDLALFYPASPAREILLAPVEESGPLGLHFVTRLGESFLVDDILALGPVGSIDRKALVAEAVAAPRPGPTAVSGIRVASRLEPAENAAQAAVLETPAPVEASPAPELSAEVRGVTAFSGIRPNPTSGGTTISFALGQEGPVRLDVYDVRGTRVRTVLAEVLGAGTHQARWDGRDDAGRRVGAGVYVVRFAANGVVAHTKAILMR